MLPLVDPLQIAASRHWRITYLILVFLVPFGLASCQNTASIAPDTSKVDFAVFTDSMEVPYHVTRFTDKITGRDFSRLFDKLAAKKIPYGRYDYALDRDDIKEPKLSTIRGSIYVNRPEVWLTLNPSGVYGSSNGREIVVDFHEPMSTTITGTVEPPPSSSNRLWVRIQGVHSTHRVEAGVDQHGKFHVYDALWGSYVVMVFEGGKLVHAEPLYIAEPANFHKLDIRLKER